MGVLPPQLRSFHSLALVQWNSPKALIILVRESIEEACDGSSTT